MKFKNILKNSLFLDSFRTAKSNPAKIGLMVLFDALFLASFFIFQNFFNYIAPKLAIPQTPNGIYPFIILIIFSFIYYLIALFVYSFFKYCLLDFIKSLFGTSKFSFKNLGKFYLLNVIIAGIFFVLSMIAGLILINIKESYQPYVFILLASPLWILYNKYSLISLHSLLFYIVVNISHSLFYEKASIWHALKNGFVITFTRISIYRKTISIIIFAAVIFGILFLGMNYLTRFLTSKNFYLYLSVNAYFQKFSVIFFDFAFYIMLLINRISFYKVVAKR